MKGGAKSTSKDITIKLIDQDDKNKVYTETVSGTIGEDAQDDIQKVIDEYRNTKGFEIYQNAPSQKYSADDSPVTISMTHETVTLSPEEDSDGNYTGQYKTYGWNSSVVSSNSVLPDNPSLHYPEEVYNILKNGDIRKVYSRKITLHYQDGKADDVETQIAYNMPDSISIDEVTGKISSITNIWAQKEIPAYQLPENSYYIDEYGDTDEIDEVPSEWLVGSEPLQDWDIYVGGVPKDDKNNGQITLSFNEDGQEVATDTLSMPNGTELDETSSQVYQDYEKKGYDLVRHDIKTDYTFEKVPQTVQLDLHHKRLYISKNDDGTYSAQEGSFGTPQTITSDYVLPNGNKISQDIFAPDAFDKKITRIINYHYLDGSPDNSVTQTVNYTISSYMVDEVTGKVSEASSWKKTGSWDAVDLPDNSYVFVEYQDGFKDVNPNADQDNNIDEDNNNYSIVEPTKTIPAGNIDPKYVNETLDVYVGKVDLNVKYVNAATGKPLDVAGRANTTWTMDDQDYFTTPSNDSRVFSINGAYADKAMGDYFNIPDTGVALSNLIPRIAGYQFTGYNDSTQATTTAKATEIIKSLLKKNLGHQDSTLTIYYTPLAPIQVNHIDKDSGKVLYTYTIPTDQAMPEDPTLALGFTDAEKSHSNYWTDKLDNIPGYEYTGEHSNNTEGYTDQLQTKDSQNPVVVNYYYQVIPGQEKIAEYTQKGIHPGPVIDSWGNGTKGNWNDPYDYTGLQDHIKEVSEKTGHQFVASVNDKTGHYTRSNNEVDLWYVPVADVVVNYIDEITGNKLSINDEVNPTEGETDTSVTIARKENGDNNWQSSQKDFKNYVFDKTDRSTTGTFGDLQQEVNYYYLPEIQKETIQKTYSRKTHFVAYDDKTHELADPVTQSVTLDGTYYVEKADPNKYVSVKTVKDADGNDVLVADKVVDNPEITWTIAKDKDGNDEVEGDVNNLGGNDYNFWSIDPAEYDNGVIQTNNKDDLSDNWEAYPNIDNQPDNHEESVDPNTDEQVHDQYIYYRQQGTYNIRYFDVTGIDPNSDGKYSGDVGEELFDPDSFEVYEDYDPDTNKTYYYWVGEQPDVTGYLWQPTNDNYVDGGGYEDQGYVLVQAPENLGKEKITKAGSNPDQFVYLKHKVIKVTKDTPTSEIPIDENGNPVVDPKSLTKTVTRTIHYQTDTGKQLLDDTPQSVTYDGSVYVDLVNGQLTKTEEVTDNDGNKVIVATDEEAVPTWIAEDTKSTLDEVTGPKTVKDGDKEALVPGNWITTNSAKEVDVPNPSNSDAWKKFTQNKDDETKYTSPDETLVYSQVATPQPDTKTVTRIIHFVTDKDHGSKTLAPDKKQTVTYTSTYYVDNDGNEVAVKDSHQKDEAGKPIYVVDHDKTAPARTWTSDNATLPEVDNPDDYTGGVITKDDGTWTTTDKADKETVGNDPSKWNYKTTDNGKTYTLEKNIVYTKDVNADVNFWDIDSGTKKEIPNVVPITDSDEHGKSGATINFGKNPQEVINQLTKDGYVLVTTDNTYSNKWTPGVKYNKDDANNHFNVYFVHNHVTKPTSKTPESDKKSSKLERTRHINYIDAETGKLLQDIAPSKTQTVTWSRTPIYDQVTGDFLGYTNDPKKLDKNKLIKIDPNLNDNNSWVSDGTGKYQESTADGSLTSPDLSDYGYQKAVSYSKKTNNGDAGKVASAQADRSKDGADVNVYYFHDTESVTSKNPKIPGTKITKDGNGKYPHGLDQGSLEVTNSRTITYVDGVTNKPVNGSPNGKSKEVQSVTFYRNAIIDKVTGKLLGYDTDGDGQADTQNPDKAWYTVDNKGKRTPTESVTFSSLTSEAPSEVGYDTVDTKEVSAISVTPTSNLKDAVVKYYRSTPTIDEIPPTKKPTPEKKPEPTKDHEEKKPVTKLPQQKDEKKKAIEKKTEKPIKQIKQTKLRKKKAKKQRNKVKKNNYNENFDAKAQDLNRRKHQLDKYYSTIPTKGTQGNASTTLKANNATLPKTSESNTRAGIIGAIIAGLGLTILFGASKKRKRD